MSDDFKKRDTADKYEMSGVRLAKDARVTDGEHGQMVQLTFVSTSRKDKHTDMWVEANISDWHANAAAFLKKGDVLHHIVGKPVMRLWGDNNEKFQFGIDKAEIVIPFELFAELKERGFEPGGGSKGKPAAKGKKTPAKGKPAGKVQPKGKPVIDLDDEDDADDSEDDED